jgi:hypothetical protein
MGGTCGTNGGGKKNVYRLLVGKREGKSPLGRPRRRWLGNIKIDLLEIGLSVVNWIGLPQARKHLKSSMLCIVFQTRHWVSRNGSPGEGKRINHTLLASTTLTTGKISCSLRV